MSARKAHADGSGAAVGWGRIAPTPTAPNHLPAIPDQFAHVYDPARKTLFFNRVILNFAKNSRKCLSMNNLHTKSRFSNPTQSHLIVPNRANSCLDAIQSQPPSCSKIPTSPILLRQTPTCRAEERRRVKAPLLFVLSVLFRKSAIRNPQFQSNPVKASQTTFSLYPLAFFP